MIHTLERSFASKSGEGYTVKATQRYETVNGTEQWYSYNWVISWGNHIVTSGNASGGGSEISTKDLHDIFKRCRFQIASFEAEWERQ